jgi:2-dehydropantoate 2-reductase
MAKKLAFMGAGAVGSYVGGYLSNAGEDVTLIDPWPDHVEAIKRDGIKISGTQGEQTAHPRALHLHEAQSLAKDPVDIAFVCTKSYDTVWATTLISQYLAPGGFIVSLQNSINEERIASVVGWGRVIGIIASTISVNAFKAGHVVRTVQPGGPGYTVFRVGEPHGRITPRAEELARMLTCIDSAKVTPNLWGERWSKLVINSMGNGVSAVTGMTSKECAGDPEARRMTIQLAGEAIAVGQAHGFDLEEIQGAEPEKWVSAAQGGEAALKELEESIAGRIARMTDDGKPSTAQDIDKGRRTEIDFLNGLVVQKGDEAGVPAPTHAALVSVVHDVERGELEPAPRLVDEIWRLARAR